MGSIYGALKAFVELQVLGRSGLHDIVLGCCYLDPKIENPLAPNSPK